MEGMLRTSLLKGFFITITTYQLSMVKSIFGIFFEKSE